MVKKEIMPQGKPSEKLLDPLLADKRELASIYREKRSRFIYKSVHLADLDEEMRNGWHLQIRYKKKARLKKEKTHDVLLENRVWCLLYKMGYTKLSEDRFNIRFVRNDGSEGAKQIDAFACDDETAWVIECKSKQDRGRRSFQKDLHETMHLQEYIRNSIFCMYRNRDKPIPKIIWVYATNNVIWSEPDVDRAKAGNIDVVTENELQYYEAFVMHMGPAAKYQILAEFLKGTKVPGMPDIKIPAIKGTLGRETFYSFVSTPRDLLRISFVNHQAFNHPDGTPAYQRMISSGRIKTIGQFIKGGGFFPTNILINFISKPKFEFLPNRENTDKNIKFGWLSLPKQYRAAWVIDGQHRLYGYSKLEDKYLDQKLFVLAFENMDNEKEADLFITINHEQKTVAKGLRVSLFADLNLDSSDPKKALNALASAIVRVLNTDMTGPLFRRFALPGIPSESTQSLTISEAVNGLVRSGLIGKIIHTTSAPGPLKGPTTENTIERSKKVLNGYFEAIRDGKPTRWELGKTAYICTNPGIRAHLMLISDMIKYLELKNSIDFISLGEQEIVDHLVDMAEPIVKFISEASDQEISDSFSRKFGEGGVKEYLFRLCELVSEKYEDFGSEEFKKYIAQKSDARVENADRQITNLTQAISDTVIEILKKVHGTQILPSRDPAFWDLGIQDSDMKERAHKKQQEDPPEKRLPKEAYLDVIDLKKIIEQKNNWEFFEPIFNIPMIGERHGKKYYTGWLAKFNELRRIPAHKSALRIYDEEDFEFLDHITENFYKNLKDYTK